MQLPQPNSTLFPYTTLFRSNVLPQLDINNTIDHRPEGDEKWFLENEKTVTQFCRKLAAERPLKDIRDEYNYPKKKGIKDECSRLLEASSNLEQDRKSGSAGMPRPISYAVFCLKKKRDKGESWPRQYWDRSCRIARTSRDTQEAPRSRARCG